MLMLKVLQIGQVYVLQDTIVQMDLPQILKLNAQ